MIENVVSFVPKIDLDTNARGTPFATIENFSRLIKAYGIKIWYDEIAKEVRANIPNKNYLPDNYINCVIAELISLMNEWRIPSGNVKQFLFSIADQSHRNPVREFIESAPWDGTSRLESFYSTIQSANEPLKEVLLKRWMISAVAAAYEPYGISAGGILVFQGPQYIGKTNWFKNLVPQQFRNLIKDGMSLDTHNKDSVMYCLSHWLVELGEIASTFRSDLDALKAFITCDKDVLRQPYAASSSTFPRRTVFFGSVNEERFLKDQTGNRRFWTIPCLSITHTHDLNMQQIWAEFKVLYDTGEKWHLDKDEFDLLNVTNEEHEITDPMKEKILDYYDWNMPLARWISSTTILEEIGYKNITHSEATRCGSIILKLNGNQKKRSNNKRLLAVPGSTSFASDFL